MRLSIAVLTLCVAHSVHSQGFFDSIIATPGKILGGAADILGGLFGGNDEKVPDLCARDVTDEYKKAVTDFSNKLFTHIAARSGNHFVFSPYSVWLSLAALAEGADPKVQSQIFASLNLPQEKCIRVKLTGLAANVERSGQDVTFRRRRGLLVDESLKVNRDWSQQMKVTRLLDYTFAPIKEDPKATSRQVRKFLSSRSNILIKGNSIVLDSLDYQGLWTTAFPEATIKSQPFFDELGHKLGAVDMMHMKKKVRLAHVPFLSAKVVELPVGAGGRYTMLIAVGTGNNMLKNAIDIFMGSILEIFSLLQISVVPLDVAIPRFAVSSEFNVRPALEDIGIRSFWRDPAATRYVSNPPAIPGGLIQRVSVRVDSEGVNPPPAVGTDLISGIVDLAENTASDVAKVVGHEFVADRPFIFALFDTQSQTCIFSGAYSRPINVK